MRTDPIRWRAGFTLIEMLAVLALILLLATVITVGSQTAIGNAKRIVCANNLRQLYLANVAYAAENDAYAPAAADLYGKNLERWHGARASIRKAFDGASGPLSPYLDSGRVRACPCQGRFATAAAANAFEAACGGYGYNAVGVGSRTYLLGMCGTAMRDGMLPDLISDPARTIMFCDTAFPQPYGSNPKYLIEYSFAEPYHWVFKPGQESAYRADPSIHFRHRGRANVVWCDGHISAESMQTRAQAHFTRFQIGWFGPVGNSLFDTE
jgi:prepilin-type N-terminal cleavage/methylation domain-containing protein/prepilin-type processing-associated H-X9-DG protein